MILHNVVGLDPQFMHSISVKLVLFFANYTILISEKVKLKQDNLRIFKHKLSTIFTFIFFTYNIWK